MTSAAGRHFRRQLLAKFEGSLVRQNGTPAERDARPRIVAVHSLQRLSIRFARVDSVKRHFGIWRAFVMLPELMKVFRRTYGKDNRVLHTAKLSQSFKVGPLNRTWQGAGISTGCAKIGVTCSETRMAKSELNMVKQ